MKTLRTHALKIYATLLAVCISVLAIAQSTPNVNAAAAVNTPSIWYADPAVWVAAVVFASVPVVFLRGGNPNDGSRAVK